MVPHLKFEITTDMELVKRMLTEPQAYVRMINDAAPPVEQFFIDAPERFMSVVAKNYERVVAIFLVFPKNPGCAEVHFCFTPSAWGTSEHTSELFLKWIWANTSLTRLVGPVPSYNSLARRLATSVGFKMYDVEVEVGTKHGRPFSHLMMELRRPAQGAAAHA